MSTRHEDIEKIAALALAPLVEVAWADGHVTPGERRAVLDAAKRIGLGQHSDFARSTLMRWLHESPPTEALERWRRLLTPILSEATSRTARKAERRLLGEARRIAKTDERSFIEGGIEGGIEGSTEGTRLDPDAGITPDEQRVLDELAAALEAID